MTQFSNETKQKIADICKKHNISELSLFGSRVRGDARPDSDYDFLVEFLPEARIGLIEFSRIQIDLADLLETKVDLVPKLGLKPLVRDNVLSEATPIYEG